MIVGMLTFPYSIRLVYSHETRCHFLSLYTWVSTYVISYKKQGAERVIYLRILLRLWRNILTALYI